MSSDEIKKVFQQNGLTGVYKLSAIKAFRDANASDWKSALFASRIVGNYTPMQTRGFAEDVGRSPDTIEDRAHAYWLFERLCKLDDGAYRRFTHMTRRLPYIYISHFRVLYDAQKDYNLSDSQILNLLFDIVQSEGGISSRKLTDHIVQRYGDTRNWTYYAERVEKELNKLASEPSVPKEIRRRALRTGIYFNKKREGVK